MKRRLSLGRFIDLLPQSRHIYRACKRYINRYDGNDNSNMYTNGEIWWLRRVLPECELVFDVGANVGNWAAMALSVNPAVSVHCFEPSEAAFKKLSSRAFDGTNLHLNHLGLSATAGETTLFVFEPASTVNSLYQRDGIEIAQTYTERVRLDTVDAYCQREGIERIDLLKIDTEGHELMVLSGATEMLQERRISRIQFEYGGAYIDAHVLLKDVFNMLSGYGYTLAKLYPRELRVVERYEQRLENFQYQNWVALATHEVGSHADTPSIT